MLRPIPGGWEVVEIWESQAQFEVWLASSARRLAGAIAVSVEIAADRSYEVYGPEPVYTASSEITRALALLPAVVGPC